MICFGGVEDAEDIVNEIYLKWMSLNEAGIQTDKSISGKSSCKYVYQLFKKTLLRTVFRCVAS